MTVFANVRPYRRRLTNYLLTVLYMRMHLFNFYWSSLKRFWGLLPQEVIEINDLLWQPSLKLWGTTLKMLI